MRKKYILLFVFVVFLSYIVFAATMPINQKTENAAESDSPNQLLHLNVLVKENTNKNFSLADIGGNFTQKVQYINTDTVTIYMDDTEILLEEALRNGYITEEDIFYYARKDARNGFCKQTVKSSHGLSHFTFAYPEYNVRLIYDVFEAPSGANHLISHLCIYVSHIGNKEYILDTYTDFISYRTGNSLDREDWGLTFHVTEASSTGISLKCTQSGGQQIGALFIDGYDLGSEMFIVERLDGKPYIGEYTLDIQMEGSTEASIDWADVYGELPGGEYQLILHIFDKFTDSQVHPMMDDFHDWQIYIIPFTIL